MGNILIHPAWVSQAGIKACHRWALDQGCLLAVFGQRYQFLRLRDVPLHLQGVA